MLKCARSKRTTKCVIVFILAALLLTSSITAPFTGPFPLGETVYAMPPTLLKARTIGELIISLFAASGTGIIAPEIVTPIYSTYSTTFEDAILGGALYVDNMTPEEALEAWEERQQVSFNLDYEQFRTYYYKSFEDISANNIDTMLRLQDIGSTDPVYGAWDNVGQILRNTANNLGLTIEQTLIDLQNPDDAIHFRLSLLSEGIQNVIQSAGALSSNTPITLPDNLDYNKYNYSITAYRDYSTRTYRYNIWELPKGFPYCTFIDRGNMTRYAYRNTSSSTIVIKRYTKTQNENTWQVIPLSTPANTTIDPTADSVAVNQDLPAVFSLPLYNTRDDAFEYLNSYNPEDEVTPIGSPSYVTDEGLYKGEAITPIIDNDKVFDIIPESEYTPMVESINDNIDANDIPPIAPTYNQFINYYITNNAPQPEQPEKPIIPDQPQLPDKPPNTPEETDAVLNMASPNLNTIFPFCIPWDLVAIYSLLDADPEAPHLKGEITIPSLNWTYSVDFDFSIYNDAAKLFRTMFFLLFLVVLSIATRNLIFA